ncbi:NAD-dependent epimerase/dehydratase family protein [Limobrevibacterium gyesilva]|uniref:NAD-dependent epimerase/dehydratase family protein n=1 Tax=Limobrevibacterium gyesilva TaxID=2991712 RepID=A0AA41YW89_9PROT|nr:NAD-dependent epimerase/dehydratase family protein [Limobrevibacterium gyesilva]MCW3477638.1 NAD-dependent epimerase/dehydratase family protein [Limobrevibacterium gyesilva]
MRISILGGGGFLGRKVASRLAADGTLGGTPVTSLTLFDLAAPPAPSAPFPVATLGGDIAALPAAAIPEGTDVVFHLAAVVSAAAEADYDLGRRVNLHGTDAVIDACRRLARPPRVVFTSSVASFSGGQGALLDDDARQVPANSYGTQKAAAEMLLADASRRGFMDAVSLRLPTIIVRPGRPNKAASSFFSAIVREPLLGLETELPVPDAFAVWVASPRRATEWLLHAAAMDTAPMGLDRSLTPPGLSVTVGEILTALEQVKPGAAALVRRVADPAIAAIVGGWPPGFRPVRAPALGFARHEPLVDVVRAFAADDLDATRRERGLG